jgi:K+-transporting ATPase ATPase A chain
MVWGGQRNREHLTYLFILLTVFLTGLMGGEEPRVPWSIKWEKKKLLILASVILLKQIQFFVLNSVGELPNHQYLSGISNPLFHGISQVVYEYTSAAANGSGWKD